ncbi:MAG TPA: hypothetical protein VMH28_07655 [Candidatus Acidoferrales bacterium]|nr:hypothetical protein [Candidatus Acidoferrales bacterium]
MRLAKGPVRILVRVVLCGCLAVGIGLAQRGGGHAGGMGGGHVSMGGGGHVAVGGGYHGGGYYGGARYGGYYGGHYYGGYYGGRYYGYPYYGGYWPYWGFGFSYWPGYSYGYPYYGYGYDYPYYSYPSYSYSYPASSYSYPQAQPGSNVTVVYPPQQAERANPSMTEYDQYGQPVRRDSGVPSSAGGGGGGSSPVYLIAFKDRTIRAVSAYWSEGGNLYYVTMDHQERQAPLDTVDRSMSEQLNRERRVPFSLGR